MPNEQHPTSDPKQPTENWFASWFDSPYYHILYKDRDYEEAQLFMDNITNYLNLPENAKILDLACGKGRHSIYLSKLGFDVTGADISENSIAAAKLHETAHLKFVRHDMRVPFSEQFDAVLNLFTSFGYFDDDADNLKTLVAIHQNLTETGFAVIDFMNVEKVIKNLVAEETKTVGGIDFDIKRYYIDDHIYKEIRFEDNGQKFRFTEKVRALTLENFEQLMDEAGIYLLDIFGDYRLKKFHKQESDRLIMIFK